MSATMVPFKDNAKSVKRGAKGMPVGGRINKKSANENKNRGITDSTNDSRKHTRQFIHVEPPVICTYTSADTVNVDMKVDTEQVEHKSDDKNTVHNIIGDTLSHAYTYNDFLRMVYSAHISIPTLRVRVHNMYRLGKLDLTTTDSTVGLRYNLTGEKYPEVIRTYKSMMCSLRNIYGCMNKGAFVCVRNHCLSGFTLYTKDTIVNSTINHKLLSCDTITSVSALNNIQYNRVHGSSVTDIHIVKSTLDRICRTYSISDTEFVLRTLPYSYSSTYNTSAKPKPLVFKYNSDVNYKTGDGHYINCVPVISMGVGNTQNSIIIPSIDDIRYLHESSMSNCVIDYSKYIDDQIYNIGTEQDNDNKSDFKCYTDWNNKASRVMYAPCDSEYNSEVYNNNVMSELRSFKCMIYETSKYMSVDVGLCPSEPFDEYEHMGQTHINSDNEHDCDDMRYCEDSMRYVNNIPKNHWFRSKYILSFIGFTRSSTYSLMMRTGSVIIRIKTKHSNVLPWYESELHGLDIDKLLQLERKPQHSYIKEQLSTDLLDKNNIPYDHIVVDSGAVNIYNTLKWCHYNQAICEQIGRNSITKYDTIFNVHNITKCIVNALTETYVGRDSSLKLSSHGCNTIPDGASTGLPTMYECSMLKSVVHHNDNPNNEQPRNVIVVVPYMASKEDRTRLGHLSNVLTRLKYLQRLNYHRANFTIIVAEQKYVHKRKFNLGRICNAAIWYAIKRGIYDTISHVIINHADMLPSESLMDTYGNIPAQPICISGNYRCPQSKKRYMGGIVSMTIQHIMASGGFPNLYWGWGGCYPELTRRLKHNRYFSMVAHYNKGSRAYATDLENMDFLSKRNSLRRSGTKCMARYELDAMYNTCRSSNQITPWWGIGIDESYNVIECNEFRHVLWIRFDLKSIYPDRILTRARDGTTGNYVDVLRKNENGFVQT